MANRATKFVSAIFVGAMVGIPVSTHAAGGADAGTADSSPAVASNSTECLTTPNRESQGQHWFYRMEPGTNRRCWYLRDQAERAPQTTPMRSNSAQSPSSNAAQPPPAATPPGAKTFSRNAQASRSPSNARAELAARPSGGVESAGVTVPKTPVFITTGTAGTQRTSATLSSSESTDTSVSSPFPNATTADGANTNS